MKALTQNKMSRLLWAGLLSDYSMAIFDRSIYRECDRLWGGSLNRLVWVSFLQIYWVGQNAMGGAFDHRA